MLIHPYTSDWVTSFIAIEAALNNCLHGLHYRIEHVGSTAVPQLDAKPIIDIDIIYNSHAAFEQIKTQLIKAGYFHNGNQGIEGREVFKRSGTIKEEALDSIRHHLYVCHADSKALERHILSRNFLRKNEAARQAYQQMKYELAEKAGQDQKIYAALKELHVNNFIDAIVAEEKNRIF